MDIYVGRQPIFDTKKRTVAYELLYRSGTTNSFPGIDGTQATATIIHNVFCTIGIEEICQGKKAFINFTEQMLMAGIPAINPSKLVVEILEDVTVKPELVAACKMLFDKKYVLALDDFIFDKSFDVLLPLTSIIKVDWRAMKDKDMKTYLQELKDCDIVLLAEKIETQEEFDDALNLGFSLFQGYFFAKPSIIAQKDVSPGAHTMIKLMAELQRPDLDFSRLSKVIEQDASMCYKLLRIINSASFGLRNPVSSIQQAMAMIGEIELKKWFALLLLANMNKKQPEEVGVSTFTKSRFAERLAFSTNRSDIASDVFFAALLSRLDLLVGRPLEELIADLPLSDEIKAALLEHRGSIAPYLELADAYERVDEEGISRYAHVLGLSMESVSTAYLEVLKGVRFSDVTGS